MNAATNPAHPFEAAGYVAPYTLQGFSGTLDGTFDALGTENTMTSMFGLEPALGGSCDVCGTHIVDMTHFVDARGQRFKTGCNCAEDADLSVQELADIRKAKKSAARARKQERARIEREPQIAAWRAEQEAARTELKALDWELLAEYAHEDEDQLWRGKTAADELQKLLDGSRNNLTRVLGWANQIVDEIEAGKREFAIEQPDFSKSEFAALGRQDLELRIFQVSDSGPAKMVDREGRIFIAWSTPDLDSVEFTAVRATVKKLEVDSYMHDAKVSVINRLKLIEK